MTTKQSATARGPVTHEVDGIIEEDNELPKWWVTALMLCIGFGIAYYMAYSMYGIFDTPSVAFEKESAIARAKEAERLKAEGPVDKAALLLLSKDSATVADGAQVFTTTCAVCHAANGGGGIGPNLTDDAWLHGGSPDAIYKTINEGVTGKGMPAWGPQLGSKRVKAAAAYVITLRGTKVPGGKEAQGAPFEGD